MKDGTVQATGRNDHGQLGDGSNSDRTNSVPVLDSGGSPFSDVTAISAGAFHSLFLKSDGTIWATGENSDGRLMAPQFPDQSGTSDGWYWCSFVRYHCHLRRRDAQRTPPNPMVRYGQWATTVMDV